MRRAKSLASLGSLEKVEHKRAMKKAWFAASLAVSLAFAPISAIAQDAIAEARPTEAKPAEQHLLGAADEEARYLAVLPFTREFTVSGTVAGSLEASAIAAGIDAAILIGAREALAAAIDSRDIGDGDRFFIRYSKTFTAAGAHGGTAIGVGRVIWLELTTAAKGTVAFHRFPTRGKGERFWLVNGQEAWPPAMRYPLANVVLSSGFGPRSDPFHPRAAASGPASPVGGPAPTAGLPPALGSGAFAGSAATPYASMALGPARRPGPAFLMHSGVDLVAPAGTPVQAAADGIVGGAAPNGAYGNWIRIDHARDLATVYGHLSQFAPGLQPGMSVKRGDVIGYVGNTGRSTGAHLHFELLRGGKPVNPMNTPEFKAATLQGPELESFRKLVARAEGERPREDGVATGAF